MPMKAIFSASMLWFLRAAIIFYCAQTALDAASEFWMWTKLTLEQSKPATPWAGWHYAKGALIAIAWQTGASVIGVLAAGRICFAVPAAIAALVLIQLPAMLLVLVSIVTIFLSFLIILCPPILFLVLACIASGAAICGAAALIVFAGLED